MSMPAQNSVEDPFFDSELLSLGLSLLSVATSVFQADEVIHYSYLMLNKVLDQQTQVVSSSNRAYPKLPTSSTIDMTSEKTNVTQIEQSAHKTLYDKGLEIRYEVAGRSYVDSALTGGSSEFARPMQELVTEACWGSVWSRPGLERKQRSLLNIAMLCALNRAPELAAHVRGALRNGASEVEIRETLLQAAIYCGMPAGIEGFKVAEKVILAFNEEKGNKS